MTRHLAYVTSSAISPGMPKFKAITWTHAYMLLSCCFYCTSYACAVCCRHVSVSVRLHVCLSHFGCNFLQVGFPYVDWIQFPTSSHMHMCVCIICAYTQCFIKLFLFFYYLSQNLVIGIIRTFSSVKFSYYYAFKTIFKSFYSGGLSHFERLQQQLDKF